MHPNVRVLSVLLVAALTAAAGCGVSPGETGVAVSGGKPESRGTGSDSTGPLVGSVNGFGFDLLATASSETSANVIVSPLSVHTNLSMLAYGATGETASEMRSVLRTDAISEADLGEMWATLLRDIGGRSSKQTLATANALWVRDDIVLQQSFAEADRQYFGARIVSAELTAPDTLRDINAWAEEATRGEIAEVVDEIPEETILCVLNAVYFEGEWATKFDRDDTGPADFTLVDGSTTTVDLMHLTEDLPYYADDTLRATRLEYRGGDSSCYVFLPEPGVTIAETLGYLADGGFDGARESLAGPGELEVVVALPTLKAEYSAELTPTLSAMGMPRAFDPVNAEFAGLATGAQQPVSLGTVLHRVKVSVDEEGTKAAAITFSTGTEACEGAGPIVYCDRPYLFAIVDEPSGAILFLGVVNDPLAEGS